MDARLPYFGVSSKTHASILERLRVGSNIVV